MQVHSKEQRTSGNSTVSDTCIRMVLIIAASEACLARTVLETVVLGATLARRGPGRVFAGVGLEMHQKETKCREATQLSARGRGRRGISIIKRNMEERCEVAGRQSTGRRNAVIAESAWVFTNTTFGCALPTTANDSDRRKKGRPFLHSTCGKASRSVLARRHRRLMVLW